jgi:hypothetical protein
MLTAAAIVIFIILVSYVFIYLAAKSSRPYDEAEEQEKFKQYLKKWKQNQ